MIFRVPSVSEAEADSFKQLVQGRVKFESNPVYPPEDCSEAFRLTWMQMTPKERRKSFILQELEKCTAVTVVRIATAVSPV